MRYSKFALYVFLMLIGFSSAAQNTLWLTNGKKFKIGNYNIHNEGYISYQTLKNRSKTVNSYDVFSIIESGGNEVIIYKQDSSYSDAFNLLEMRAFVQGETDAVEKFKSPMVTVGGIAVAGTSAVLINPVLVVLISGGYCTGIGLTNPPKRKINIPDEYLNNQHYLLGYQKQVKHKRIKNSILGTGIGMVVGFATFAIIKNNQ